MGDVDCGEPGILADAPDLAAHLEAELGVEVGKGFVEEETTGPDDEGAGEGDALLLAARELVDLAGAKPFQPHHGEGLFDTVLDLAFGNAALFETEGDVAEDVEVRPEGVALEHHPGLALVGWHAGDVVAVEEDAALVGEVKSGDGAEEGRLAAAGRTE
jgi:hypothetical protein